MKKYRYLIVLAVFLFAAQAMAQPGPSGGHKMRERMKERIKTIKIWKLTEEVDLTSDQSEKFFHFYELPEIHELEKFHLLRSLY